MNLFNNYCYPDLTSAASAELSSPVQFSSIGVSSGSAMALTGVDTVNFTFHITPSDGSTPYDLTATRVYPECSQVGYLTNYTGLSIADTVEVSFGVILLWVIAFSFRAMARPTGYRP